jgi:hypothetical protein
LLRFSYCSVTFEPFYQSEVIEDTPNISPCLVAELCCALDKNIKIKIQVLYTSNLASKEIVLSSGLFSFDELLRQSSGLLEVPLQSEYTVGAKAFVEVVAPLRPVLQDAHVQLCAPINTNSAAPNPINQNYVFYSEDDVTTPVVDVEEYAWEPRLAMKLSLLFLDNIRIKAFQSYQAWTERLLLEEMRQGQFYSTQRALSSGWSQLSVSIKAARINCVDFSTSSRSKTGASSLLAGVDSPQSAAHRQAVPPPPPGTQTPQQNTNVAFYSHYPIYLEGLPSIEPDAAINSISTLSPAASAAAAASATVAAANASMSGSYSVSAGSTSPDIRRLSSAAEPRGSTRSLSSASTRTYSKGGGVSSSMLEQLKGTKKKVRVDETLPSTYVEIYYEDR